MVGKTGPRQLFLFLDAGMVGMGFTRNCPLTHTLTLGLVLINCSVEFDKIKRRV